MVTAVLALALAAAVSGDDVVVERILAVVDNEIVLKSEVDMVLDAMMRAQPPPPGVDATTYKKERRKEILDTLIADKLLEQQIKALHIDVTEEEVNRIVEGTIAQYGLTPPQLEQALAQQGMTISEYREGLKKQLLKAKIIQLKVKNRVQVTDQDVKSTLAKVKRQNAEEVQLKARHMVFLVKTDDEAPAAKKRAEAALARVKKGEAFADVAAELSEGPTAKAGGFLGTFGKGQMMPEFEEAAYAAEVGVPVGPVRTRVGWHLILVEERVTQEAPSQEAAEAELRQRLYENEIEAAFMRYVDELKQKAYIEIRE